MPMLVGISGATRCGKGSLSKGIKHRLGEVASHLRVAVVGQDRFFDQRARSKLVKDGQAPTMEHAWEHTASIDFAKFVKAVQDACATSDVVIVEGYRAFHESGLLLKKNTTLTAAMKLRFWLEISENTCRMRRMATKAVNTKVFDEALWPLHEDYKAEVMSAVQTGAVDSLIEISGEDAPNEILAEAMQHVLAAIEGHPVQNAKRQPHNGASYCSERELYMAA